MPDPVNLGFAMSLPPEKAIEYFESKGYAISFRWRDVFREQHRKAFTVAGAMKMDVLMDIREAVDTALTEGQTFRQFRQNLEPILQKKGWWGLTEILDESTGEVRTIDVNPRRLRRIYRTNLQTSYMGGRWNRMSENRDRRPYGMYIAIIDQVTRQSHEDQHRAVYRLDDPIWNWLWPPNDWECRCRVRSLSERRLKALDLNVSDGSAMEKFTGEGWDYNPGIEDWQPDPKDYPEEIFTQYTNARENYQAPDVHE